MVIKLASNHSVALLLMDDVRVWTKTLEAPPQLLAEHNVITLVMKGRADFVLFAPIGECAQWLRQVQEIREPINQI